MTTCPKCEGDGLVVTGWDEEAYENIEGTCPKCGGGGVLARYTCPRCFIHCFAEPGEPQPCPHCHQDMKEEGRG